MILLRLARIYRRLRERRAIGVVSVLTTLAVCILGNTICFVAFEPSSPEDPVTFGDGLWYSIISITTIGYGDYSATTFGSRLGTIVFIVLLGLSTFSVFLGMSIEWAADAVSRGRRGLSDVMAKDHVVVVNFPSRARVEQLVSELHGDPTYADREIVLVNDVVDQIPIEARNVLFVHGHVLQEETYERARIREAEMVIVLATSYSDPNSDAVVASTVSVVNRLRPELHIVAECLEPKHRMLFDSVNCDAIVLSMQVSANLLVQEAFDPGISQLVDVITSNVRGTTMYSTLVDSESPTAYDEFAKRLLDGSVNLVCVNRGTESLTAFTGLRSEPGDRVLYAAERRMTWHELVGMAGPSTQ